MPRGRPEGNPGNKGGGRKSAYEEMQDAMWHTGIWNENQAITKLKNKIKSGFYSAKDVFALKALTGNIYCLNKLADKMLPDLLDGKGLKGVLPTPILNVFYNDGNKESGQPEEADTGGTGGNVGI